MEIATDCKRITQQLTCLEPNHLYLGALISSLLLDFQRSGKATFKYFPRTANRVVHGLATLGAHLSSTVERINTSHAC